MTRDEGPPAAITSRLNSCNREAPSPSLCSHLKAAPVFWHGRGETAAQNRGPSACRGAPASVPPGRDLCAVRCHLNKLMLSLRVAALPLEEHTELWLALARHKRGVSEPSSLHRLSAGVSAYRPWLTGELCPEEGSMEHRVGFFLSLCCNYKAASVIPAVSQTCSLALLLLVRRGGGLFFIFPRALEDLGIHTTLCIIRSLKRKGLLTEKTPDNSYTVGEDGAGGILG